MLAIFQKKSITIKVKLIFFALVGISGVCSIFLFNKYFESSKVADMHLDRLSGVTSVKMMTVMLLEEKLIHASNKDLSEYEAQYKALRAAMTALKENAQSKEIQDITEEIFIVESKHSKTFLSILEALTTMGQVKVEYNRSNEVIRTLLRKVIESVDMEAFELIMEGETLSPEKVAVRKETVDFITFGNEKLINLLGNLFLYNDLETYTARKKEIDKSITTALGNLTNIYQATSSKEYTEALKGVKKILANVDKQETRLVNEWMKSKSLMPVLAETGNQIKDSVMQISELSQQEFTESSQNAYYNSIFIISVTIVALLVLSFIIIKGVIKPINQAVLMLKDIAKGEGDLTKSLDVKNNDEIGCLAKWFNMFVCKLKNIIREITGNSDKLNQASGKLSTISKSMSDGAVIMSEKSNTVASAAGSMSTTMTSIAAATEESSTNIHMVSTATEEMTSTITEIAKHTEQTKLKSNNAASQAQKILKIIDDLGNSAKEIGYVVQSISDISDQTNILALNATIESSRAGEAGKGFAVVANEIKELSKQTALATKEIQTKIENIQSSATSTITEIDEITDQINDVNTMIDSVATSVEEQSVTTREIAGNVTQASVGIQEVAEQVTKIASVANDIAKDIDEVSNEANEMTNNSVQINNCSDNLNKLSDELKKTVRIFKI